MRQGCAKLSFPSKKGGKNLDRRRGVYKKVTDRRRLKCAPAIISRDVHLRTPEAAPTLHIYTLYSAAHIILEQR